jgi:hypothetical protein
MTNTLYILFPSNIGRNYSISKSHMIVKKTLYPWASWLLLLCFHLERSMAKKIILKALDAKCLYGPFLHE